MSHHTTGPWHPFIDKRQGPLVSVYDCELVPDGDLFRVPFGANLVAVACNVGDMPTTINNGRLIAAAPDLVNALQWMLDAFSCDVLPDESGWDAVEHARAALAKAGK